MGRDYLLTQAKCLKLDITVPHEEMLAEAKVLREHFIKYDQGIEYVHSGWHALPLHGLGADKTKSYQAYGYTDPNTASDEMQWTIFANKCPVTMNWLNNVFPSGKYGRVRFMLLEAGGHIAPHIDSEHTITEAVNVALNNPKGCVWTWGDNTTLQFYPGDAYAMNISYQHAVTNASNEDRYHLIVHHHDSTVEWKNMMINAMKTQNETGNFFYSKDLY